MKIKKNATDEYTDNNINENNGYTRWYDREKVRRKRNAFMIWMRLGLFLSLFICAKFKGAFLKVNDWRFGALIIAVFVTSVFIIMPLRDIIKLAVASGGKLNEKCVLSCYKDPGSIYNGFINKKRIIVSLIVPVVILSEFFITVAIFTQGVLQFYALIMSLVSVHITMEDMYMLIYCIKHINKNDVVFGEYRKNG